MKRRIAGWENGHSTPDEFYGPLLCEVYRHSPAELATEAAHCFHDADKAKKALAHAENDMNGSHVRSDFFATMALADAHARAGNPEEARKVPPDALDLSAQLKSWRRASHLAESRTNLSRYGNATHVHEPYEHAGDHRPWRKVIEVKIPYQIIPCKRPEAPYGKAMATK